MNQEELDGNEQVEIIEEYSEQDTAEETAGNEEELRVDPVEDDVEYTGQDTGDSSEAEMLLAETVEGDIEESKSEDNNKADKADIPNPDGWPSPLPPMERKGTIINIRYTL